MDVLREGKFFDLTRVLVQDMHSENEWLPHIDESRILDTRQALLELAHSVRGQIATYGETTKNADWLRRARHLLNTTETRLGEVEGIIRSDLSIMDRYVDFADELATELKNLGYESILDSIDSPIDGLSALEWLGREC